MQTKATVNHLSRIVYIEQFVIAQYKTILDCYFDYIVLPIDAVYYIFVLRKNTFCHQSNFMYILIKLVFKPLTTPFLVVKQIPITNLFYQGGL